MQTKGSYLRYLPEIYEDDALMARFLMLFESFWARFGWLNVSLAEGWYYALWALCGVAGAGVLLDEPDFPLIAETLGRVLHEPGLRQGIIARQRRRLDAFRTRDLDAELRAALAPLLPG